MIINESDLWVVPVLDDKLFALPVDNVETMVMVPVANVIPKTPDYIRGVINIRGKVIPAVDLRKRLGMPSLFESTEKMIDMLTQREEDHKNWLKELELSVQEEREFSLTTDPHKCAFGKWYDSFTTSNFTLSSLLKKFDEPHKRIHEIGNQVKTLSEQNNVEDAQKLINDTKNGDLAEMIELFTSLRESLRDSIREIAIVLKSGEETFAVIVDSIETISHLTIDDEKEAENIGINLDDTGLVTSVAKLDKTDKLVLILDVPRLLIQEV